MNNISTSYEIGNFQYIIREGISLQDIVYCLDNYFSIKTKKC